MSADLLALLLRAMLAASAAIAVVLALRAVLRRSFGAGVAYAFWLLVPIATLASFLPARRVAAEGAATTNNGLVLVTTDPSLDTSVTTVAPNPIEVLTANADFSPLVLGLWLFGFSLSVALLLIGQQRFLARLELRQAENGVHIADGDVVGPAVIGVVAPRIVLPADFDARYTAVERALVLEHERAHIRAGDVQINALAAFLQCAMWFNPLVYIARAALRIDQELACDERVMKRHAGSRRTYAEAMLKTQLAARAVPLGCAWPPLGAGPLKQRIAMLARPHIAASRRGLGAALCATLTLAAGVAAWAAQPPRAHAEASSNDWFGWGGARLVEALIQGDADQARALIAEGVNVNHLTIGDGTPLIIAARYDDPSIAEALLRAGADVNKPSPGDGNPLIVASGRGTMTFVRMFVEAGADVNAIVYGDETPLINAARHGHTETVRYLLQHGADPSLAVVAPTVDGSERRSPLNMARRGGHADIVALLTAAGARE